MFVPVAIPEMVVVEPVPENDPGLIVQANSGKPVNITLPVARVHEGWVIGPTIGAVGALGAEYMIISAEAGEIHPSALVTV